MLVLKQQAIHIETELLEPIVFLDIFSYPVTAYELWQFIGRKYSLNTVITTLNDLQQKNILAFKAGFYFLVGQDDLVEIRRKRHNYTCQKLRIATRFSRLFSLFPGVKMIAAANLIGGYNLRLASDIDLFIITKPGQLWLSRLFCAGLAQLLHSRPTTKCKKNKICLSFYVSTAALSLKNLELNNGDPYFDYWQKGLRLLYDKQNTWLKFLRANNLFLFDQRSIAKTCDKDIFSSADIFIRFLEKIAKVFQVMIMSRDLKKALSQEKGVLITDDVLKLYLQDRRLEFLNKFNIKMHEISKKIN